MSQQLPLVLDAPPPRRRRAAALCSHHLRSHQPADEALEGEKKAAAQEEAILELLRADADACQAWDKRRWTPSEVHEAFRRWPITSIRRALTNLTNRGLLIHYPADRRQGPRGGKESTWGLA